MCNVRINVSNLLVIYGEGIIKGECNKGRRTLLNASIRWRRRYGTNQEIGNSVFFLDLNQRMFCKKIKQNYMCCICKSDNKTVNAHHHSDS